MVAVKAHFDGKVIVLDEEVDLPKDQPLLVDIQVAKARRKKKKQSVFDWIVENSVKDDGLPADLGYQHDHYLYGTPKKKPPRKKPPQCQ
jgi:hypothetical protein